MYFKNLLKLSGFILLVCFFVLPAMAQNKSVSGKVTDSKDGSPVIGASVLAKGTTAGAVTDINGSFKLSVPASATTLVITYIGYDRKEVAITDAPLSITLDANATSLSEVAVVSIGYGSSRKKDLTGAVASISSKNFNQGAVINPVDQLAGKVAGLVITQPGGDPNQNASIRLRGQSSIQSGLTPLFVVDGIILSDPNQFQNIPPSDIASYDILKDASASAIYGSRGSNGVIIVTTKRGKAGNAVVSYDGLTGLSNQSKYYDLLSAADFRADVPNLGTIDKGASTDWQRAMVRTAYQQRHNVSVSGGGSTFNYIASVNYSDQQGIVITSDKKQLGMRFNGEAKVLNDKLDIKVGIQNVNTTRNFVDYSIFSYMFNSPPTYPIKNPDGSYYAYSDFNLANPIEHLQMPTLIAYEYLTLMNGSADYSITNALKIGVLGSTTRNNVQTHGFIPVFPLEGNVNQAEQAQENNNSYSGNMHINYDKTFGKSTLNATAVYEFNDYLYDNFLAAGQQYITPDELDNNLGAGNSSYNNIGSYKNEYMMISYLARVAYSYDNRFYVTGSLRRDGSSKLGINNQWETFPSVSGSYRFKKDLLSNVDWIDDIKIRAGYGVTGNQDGIGPYNSLALVAPSGKYYNAATGAYLSAYSPFQNQNGNLRWEERRGTNIGLDFSLFNGSLTADINYFSDKTTNLLANYTLPTPPYTFSSILANVGSLTNKGVEFALTGQIVKGRNFNWSANGQISFVTTLVGSLSGNYTIDGVSQPLTATSIPVASAVGRGLSSNPISFLKPGYTPFVFYLPHYTGVDGSGNQTFDGKTIAQWGGTAPSHYIDPSPKFNYGLTNNFDYGNWNLNFALRGVYGQKIFNNTLLDIETVTRLPGNNITKEALTNGIKDAPVASDKWLESASFLRMDNATLGYAFKNISFASSFRVFVSTNNLFVITKYRGLDPEVKADPQGGSSILFNKNLNGAANQAYIDSNYGSQGYYPRVRSFTLGVNITLK